MVPDSNPLIIYNINMYFLWVVLAFACLLIVDTCVFIKGHSRHHPQKNPERKEITKYVSKHCGK